MKPQLESLTKPQLIALIRQRLIPLDTARYRESELCLDALDDAARERWRRSTEKWERLCKKTQERYAAFVEVSRSGDSAKILKAVEDYFSAQKEEAAERERGDALFGELQRLWGER